MTARFGLKAGAAAAALLLGATGAHAAGFALKEHSAGAQGSSFAGVSAGGTDISAMFFNPATMSLYDGARAENTVAVILPAAEISNVAGTNRLGGAITGGGETSDTAAFVPSLFGSYQLNDRLTFGVGVTAPFGLTTDYGTTWGGRYHATESAMKTYNVTPAVSYKLNDMISLGAGLQVQYVDATLGNAVDLGAIAGNPALAGRIDALAELKGTDFGFGFTLGAVAEPMPGTRFGVGYRSKIDHDVDGDVTFAGTNATATTVLGTLRGVRNIFNNGAATTSVSTPASLNFGASHQLTDKIKLMGEAQWTQWSSFKELRIKFADSTPDSVTTENWKDSWYFALGAEYQATPQLALRLGVGYDQTPVPDEYRTPRIPDSDRTWISVGASYKMSDHLNLNAAYTYISAADATLNLSGAGENTNRGSLSGDLSANVHILTVSGEYRF